jgi:ankyrin repeat protein
MKRHEKNDLQHARPHKKSKISLHHAAKRGDIETIQNLLPRCNINEKNDDEETPLFVAIKYNQEAAATVLLKNGAYPNTFNKKGIDPLRKAIKNGSVACTRLLIENGANLFLIEEQYIRRIYPHTPFETKLRKECKVASIVHATLLQPKLELLAFNENNNQ